MKKLIMIGAGNGSRPVCNDFRLLENPEYEFVGFLDSNPELEGKEIDGLPVFNKLEKIAGRKEIYFINGINDPKTVFKREGILEKMGLKGAKFATLVHPKAYVSPSAEIGKGVVIYPEVYVGHNAKMKDHTIVLPNSTINHDVVVGEYSVIAAGVQVSGSVNIGKGCYIGTGSCIKEKVSLGDYSLIGMGSIVLKGIAPYQTVVGNPAKVIRSSRD